MLTTLVFLHSVFRWFVLGSLGWSIIMAYDGYTGEKVFTSRANSLRHWTATIAHIQLVLGIILYTQSPAVKSFWYDISSGLKDQNALFFGIVHMLMMLVAIVVITIGSALSKRKNSDREKFRTMLLWFSVGLLLIFLAIPWPFSPLAHRPYFRFL